MKNKILFLSGVFAVVGIFFLFGCGREVTSEAAETSVANAEESLQLSGEIQDGVRVVPVIARRYEFDPDPVVVNEGEAVRLVVTSEDVDHGVYITEYDINLDLPAGETNEVIFTADQVGEFELVCSVYCGSGHRRMMGTLVVLARDRE